MSVVMVVVSLNERVTKCGICEDASSEAELWHTRHSPDSKTFDRADLLEAPPGRIGDAVRTLVCEGVVRVSLKHVRDPDQFS